MEKYNRRSIIITSLGLVVAGCAPTVILPESGPTLGAVVKSASIRMRVGGAGDAAAYVLVPLDETIVTKLHSVDTGPKLIPVTVPPVSGKVGIGDILSVTIFESDSGGLFLPKEPGTRSGNYVTLPNQQVDATGHITVPFAGPVHVADLSAEEAEHRIENLLGPRALEPQAIVSVVQRNAEPVSVLGEVTTAAHFSLDPNGEHILGAIARAGGPRYPAYESMVTLQRGGRVEKELLYDVAQNPVQNIELMPGDTIYISHEPRYFLALGATASTSQLGPVDRRISFGDANITLADAIAHAGGLADNLANARGAFVYRFESRATLTNIGVPGATRLPALVPTVYVIDLSGPAAIFYASQFWMRSEDVLYVSNAPVTDLDKFLNAVLPAADIGTAVKVMTQ